MKLFLKTALYTKLFVISFLSICLFLSSSLRANAPDIHLQPQVTIPVNANNSTNSEVARLCRQQACCIYDGKFYSEGAIVSLNNIILQCSRNPNVAGAGAVTWTQLK